MNRRYRLLAAASLLPACSTAPAAYRGRANPSATPQADAGPDVTAAPLSAATSAGPATSSAGAVTGGARSESADLAQKPATSAPADTTTTVTFTAPHATTTTTLAVATTLPERADDHLSDAEWVGREALLACIRSYEQGAAGYGTETGNGYHGAYQDTQGTWDHSVAMAGHPEWVGRRAGDAPAWIQDDAAWALYKEQGLSPWPTPSRRCR